MRVTVILLAFFEIGVMIRGTTPYINMNTASKKTAALK